MLAHVRDSGSSRISMRGVRDAENKTNETIHTHTLISADECSRVTSKKRFFFLEWQPKKKTHAFLLFFAACTFVFIISLDFWVFHVAREK